ncbi:M20 metallopeptidase family protein [Sphingobacterium sp. LRF_L2]|uniref:M20 metallopeptidase family protein n=1 Tax=Sphingobacterium sp. LRF_L2 TaxID=3369421 RepID=UPI003F6387DD
MMIKDFVRRLISENKEEVVSIRRHLHANPELSFNEYETSRFIKDRLTVWDIPWREIAGTGVLAEIKGTRENNDNCIMLRADIDALPIQENTGLPFSSLNDGVMHACGHDFHTANLLGVGKVLKEMSAQFSGTVLLLFQPAEEKIPGGAQAVLEAAEFALYKDRVQAVLGLHVSPRLPSGTLGLCGGKFMASSDEFYVRIKGKGGHGAEPHLCVDPVTIAAQLITALQQIVSRLANPQIPSVLSFGKVVANGAANVIPDEVYMEGTFRTVDEGWRSLALDRIRGLIEQLPRNLGADVELEVRHGYPFLLNNEELAQQFLRSVGDTALAKVELVDIWMAAEDFAYYSHRFPSLFYLVGVNKETKNGVSGLHTATFDLDEDAFQFAMQSMLQITFDLLAKDVSLDV